MTNTASDLKGMTPRISAKVLERVDPRNKHFDFTIAMLRLCVDSGVSVMYKSESTWQVILSYLAFFTWRITPKGSVARHPMIHPRIERAYLATFSSVTPTGSIYLASVYENMNLMQSAHVTLGHELVHVAQARRWGSFIFAFLYAFPQNLGLLALLGVFYTPLFLFIALLLPFPAPFRMKFEAEAYAVNVYVRTVLEWGDTMDAYNRYVKTLCGPAYYYAWYDQSTVYTEMKWHSLESSRTPATQDVYAVYDTDDTEE